MDNKYLIIYLLIILVLLLINKNNIENFNDTKNIDDSILNLKNNYFNNNNLYCEKIVILTSHYNEDLFWLKGIDLPFIIASKNVSNNTLYIPINKGNECSAYLTYIIKYYDYLPEFTLFLHGHYTHWHQSRSIFNIINNITFDKQFLNINDVCLDDRDMNNPVMYELKKYIWDYLFKDELGEMPPKFYDYCCAQFLVHRDRIRLRSKQFYINILNYINVYDIPIGDGIHGNTSYYLEYIWHYIFGEDAIREL